MHNQHIGRIGEDAAETYLIKEGYTIVKRNFRTSSGEIDIIAHKADVYAFVEVKTRTSAYLGEPEECVSSLKYHRILLAAYSFLNMRTMTDVHITIDVIAVVLSKRRTTTAIHHFKNLAF